MKKLILSILVIFLSNGIINAQILRNYQDTIGVTVTHYPGLVMPVTVVAKASWLLLKKEDGFNPKKDIREYYMFGEKKIVPQQYHRLVLQDPNVLAIYIDDSLHLISKTLYCVFPDEILGRSLSVNNTGVWIDRGAYSYLGNHPLLMIPLLVPIVPAILIILFWSRALFLSDYSDENLIKLLQSIKTFTNGKVIREYSRKQNKN